MKKSNKKYFIFNTVFMILQIALLMSANIINLVQAINNTRRSMSILAYVVVDVIIMQLFFAECCSIVLARLSYVNRWKKVMIWFDFLGIAVSAVLIVYSSVWGVLIGIEGAPFPKAIYVEIASGVLLIMKTMVDGAIAISGIRHRKKDSE